jgi:hypothetical protein
MTTRGENMAINVAIGNVKAKLVKTQEGELVVNSIHLSIAGVRLNINDFNPESKAFDRLLKKLELKARKVAKHGRN